MIAVAAFTAATTAYSISEQRSQAAWQADVDQQNADRANEANLENYKLQNQQLNLQELQENEQAAQEKHKQALAVQKGVAEARVSAGEAGVSGLSIDSIFADVVRQGAENMTTIDRNLADSQQQRDADRKVLYNNTLAGVQNPQSYKSKTANLGAGLQIIGSGLGGYTSAGGKFGKGSSS
jgi:hypothetical protein